VRRSESSRKLICIYLRAIDNEDNKERNERRRGCSRVRTATAVGFRKLPFAGNYFSPVTAQSSDRLLLLILLLCSCLSKPLPSTSIPARYHHERRRGYGDTPDRFRERICIWATLYVTTRRLLVLLGSPRARWCAGCSSAGDAEGMGAQDTGWHHTVLEAAERVNRGHDHIRRGASSIP
jgi:hypothetical protein